MFSDSGPEQGSEEWQMFFDHAFISWSSSLKLQRSLRSTMLRVPGIFCSLVCFTLPQTRCHLLPFSVPVELESLILLPLAMDFGSVLQTKLLERNFPQISWHGWIALLHSIPKHAGNYHWLVSHDHHNNIINLCWIYFHTDLTPTYIATMPELLNFKAGDRSINIPREIGIIALEHNSFRNILQHTLMAWNREMGRISIVTFFRSGRKAGGGSQWHGPNW